MNKKFIASFIFLILSVFIFLFFIMSMVPAYVPLFIQFNVELPWITRMVLQMADTVTNWSIVIIPLIFLFLIAIIFAALSAKRIELLVKVNVAIAVFFLVLSFVSYVGMKLPIMKIMQIIE